MPTNDYSKNIIYLSKEQYQELITNETLTVNGQTITYNDNDIYVTPQAEPITDVKINGTSIGSNGVANIPVSAATTYGSLGVIKVRNGYDGLKLDPANNDPGRLALNPTSAAQIKAGNDGYLAVTTARQHEAIFYGLSKVAGIDLAAETVTLGIYPDTSKAAIQSMLGITDLIASEEAATATVAHAANSLFMMDGKLMRATTAIAAADAVEVGTNCEVTNISNAFATNINLNLKADKTDTVLLTTLSRGRKASTTVGENSFAFGYDATASAKNSFAIGNSTVASGLGSIATGILTTASAKYSHTEGSNTKSSGFYSHAEGEGTIATGNSSHSEGYNTVAIGAYAHTEGMSTIANGSVSHAAGRYNVADSYNNWPEWVANTQYSVGDKVKITTTVNNETIVNGYICKASNSDASFTSSNWNQDFYINYAEIIGNGTADNTRSNARSLDWNGNEYLNGYLYVGCDADSTGGTRLPHDIQVNGTSVVSNGVANIPKADASTFGVIKAAARFGIQIGTSTTLQGILLVAPAQLAEIKAADNTDSSTYKPITPRMQHNSVFYGLAKAAGDTTQSISTNAVGIYTDDAKAAIQSMLGVPGDVQVNGTSVVSNGVANVPVISAYNQVGLIQIGTDSGLLPSSLANGSIMINPATDAYIKAGNKQYFAITTTKQHAAVFYGLAKAAGADMASSDNAIGTYTETAKVAIRNMLGATSSNVIAVQDEQPTDTDTKVWLPETEAQGIQVPTMEDMNTALAEKVNDVQINGTSIINNGVANIPIADASHLGMIRVTNGSSGLQIDSGNLSISTAGSTIIQAGTNNLRPLTPFIQHISTFYGLAKAAGDTTQSISTNAVGTYTDEAKTAIQNMLSVASVADLNNKADKNNTVLTGSLSLGRKANTTIGINSIAIGYNVTASNNYTFSVGYQNIASGPYSVAEGVNTQAIGAQSHTEGINTQALAQDAHAEGYASIAKGSFSHAEGCGTIASANGQHAMGCYNVEDLWQSWDEWVPGASYSVGDKIKVTTNENDSVTVQGYECITANNDTVFTATNWQANRLRQFVEVLGIGESPSLPMNGRTMSWEGNEYIKGNIYVNCNNDSTGGTRLPHDIQVNGTSVVSNGVANIPKAQSGNLGVVCVNSSANYGILVNSNGQLQVAKATDVEVKAGTNTYKPIAPSNQDVSTFYGLAKAAGDTTMASSSNAVGTYTSEAKAAIHTMLGIDPASIAAQVDIPLVETVSGTTPTITGQPNVRYVCGEVSTITITPPASGSVDVIFESGSTATTMTVPSTVKWPTWFDAEALETNTTYEVLITDGIYGSVMTWVT